MNILRTEDRSRSVTVEHLYPVILCGGSGKRLWPLSRQAYPKQLLSLLSDKSMLQETAARTRDALGLRAPILLCNDEHKFLISEQLAAIDIVPTAILCEPISRNTAPALSAAAHWLRDHDPEAVMLVLPSDHYIGDDASFAAAVTRASLAAVTGRLVTFGIKPTHPEVGYGYIERGAPLDGAEGAYLLAQFIEKPDLDTAERLIREGSYYWNSGMFLLPVASFIEELGRHSPKIAAATSNAVAKSEERDGFIYLDRQSFSEAPDSSIDYAVMEHTDKAVVLPVEIGWSDVGSWRALHDIKECDESGNVTQGDVVMDGVHNSYIRGTTDRLVAALGISDMIIIDTEDALLVSNTAHAAEVGRMVENLKERKRPELEHHKRVHRPWGYYQTIELSERFQVKHLMVKPGAQLSLQMHHHRAEHWTVVGGTGMITVGDQVKLMSENESVFIPIGGTHRLENPGKVPLHVIEVQVGSYLGEDDIVRFEDTYGRA
jgi:mannose-1-phosphate guanylyltransferase/mannose-6-phosphate isomerase